MTRKPVRKKIARRKPPRAAKAKPAQSPKSAMPLGTAQCAPAPPRQPFERGDLVDLIGSPAFGLVHTVDTGLVWLRHCTITGVLNGRPVQLQCRGPVLPYDPGAKQMRVVGRDFTIHFLN